MIGIKPGMVMQRGTNDRCDILLQSGTPLRAASWKGDTSGEAVLENCGEGVYRLSGIPSGGPYIVTIDGERFDDVYVGDLWILAGQSNMQGLGRLTDEDRQFPGRDSVRALFMNDEWNTARHPLHELWKAVDKIHTDALASCDPPEVIVSCVGPGLEFALQMERYTGVPQGLVCCAHGGTFMDNWSPAVKDLGPDKSFYAAMLRRFRTNGSHVRGMFWYQGCCDAYRPANEQFTDKMINFIAACRQDMGRDLPVVQIQICRFVSPDTGELGLMWNDIRERQRTMDRHIQQLVTLSTIGKTLDDPIHLSSSSQKEVGSQAAEAMYWQLYGSDRNGCLPPPTFRDYRIMKDDFTGTAVIEVRYDNLHGGLTSAGRPVGFTLCDAEDKLTDPQLFDIRLRDNVALLRTACPPQELKGRLLYYGYGLTPVCNITDRTGRDLPAMGPIKLTMK